MRVLAKVACGLGAVVGIYYCVGFLAMSFRHGTPKHDAPDRRPASTHEDNLSQVAQRPPRSPVFVQRTAEQPVKVTPAASAPRREPSPEEHSEPDKRAELAATLEGQYAVDARPTRDSVSKETALEAIFSQPELDGKGQLQELKCRQSICRGVIRIANEGSDNEVFGRTFMSEQFMGAINDAVSISSREKQSDGSIVATFYIHPQSIFQMVAP